MKVIVGSQAIGGLMTGLQRTLWTIAAVSLGYVAWVLGDAWTYQTSEQNVLTQLTSQKLTAPGKRDNAGVPAGAATPALPLIGRLDIPRLGVSVIAAEGVASLTLRRGVGHIPGTSLPGEVGNAAFSGHRDTFFRPLKNVRARDLITLTTPLGHYRYRVVSVHVVAPSDIQVLDQSKEEVLTLVTCYPFYLVGPAPSRFVVRAERIS
jgi:sortase A